MASASETRLDLSLAGFWPLKANFLNEMSIHLSAEVTSGHCNMADTMELALCEPFLKWERENTLQNQVFIIQAAVHRRAVYFFHVLLFITF